MNSKSCFFFLELNLPIINNFLFCLFVNIVSIIKIYTNIVIDHYFKTNCQKVISIIYLAYQIYKLITNRFVSLIGIIICFYIEGSFYITSYLFSIVYYKLVSFIKSIIHIIINYLDSIYFNRFLNYIYTSLKQLINIIEHINQRDIFSSSFASLKRQENLKR